SSCCSASAIRPSNSFLYGRSRSGLLRVIFSVTSAARIRTKGSSDHKPLINPGSIAKFLETTAATSLARPMDRRSPPLSTASMSFGGIEEDDTPLLRKSSGSGRVRRTGIKTLGRQFRTTDEQVVEEREYEPYRAAR